MHRVLRFQRLLIAVILALSCLHVPATAQRGRGKASAPKIRLPASVRGKGTAAAIEVAGVRPARRGETATVAGEIDRLVARELTRQGIDPNPAVSDEIFLRRLYLDVGGRIPTPKEASEFLASHAANKRRDLIDRLLGSPDYVFNFYNFWADILRLQERPQPNIIAAPYLAYVKDAVRTNKPYDAWVYEMLTADGELWDNPAVGFQLRDDGQPLAYVDNTVRVFLGTQIGCAQCHDHPFDIWTQKEFYQLAAFTAGTHTRMTRRDPEYKNGNRSAALIREGRERYPGGRLPGEFRRLVRANTYKVSESPRNLKLPHDYAYSDARPNSVVKPNVLWDTVPDSATEHSPRRQFAAWLTAADNEAFAETIANRIWKRFLGVGIVEPVDDLNVEHPRFNPALLDFLAAEIVRLDFDLKAFMRTILYSDTYQREATAYKQLNSIRHPGLGAWVNHVTERQNGDLPDNIFVGSDNGQPGAGFLPPNLSPVPIANPKLGLQNTELPSYWTEKNFNRRYFLANRFDEAFRGKYAGTQLDAYNEMYIEAKRLMSSDALAVFDIKQEPEKIREAYGDNRLGQGCLLARRLVESGVRYVEVNFGGWDMHQELYSRLDEKATQLDIALSSLLRDLHRRGLLEETMVVLKTEFGRSPKINENAGRDHHPGVFSGLLAGAGVRTGQVYGASDPQAMSVAEDPVSISDLHATIATALGIDTEQEHFAPNGRPFKIGGGGKPIAGLLA